MSPDSLPYTVLILLVELAVGSLAFATVFDARGVVTRGYVQMAGIIVVPTLLLAAAVVFSIGAVDDIDGYELRPGALDVLRALLVVFALFALLHLGAAVTQRQRGQIVFGVAGSAAGVGALAALAVLVGGPAWSDIGMFGSMLAGAAVLGGSLMAMSWGHWYLTNAGLPKESLQQMSLVVLGALALQALFVTLAVVIPAREVPLTESAFGVSLGQNPAFWLRVGVGLAFPALLAWLAFQAASIRGMMSATGLLYIATGAVLAGEVLARGLLFATGAPV